jgi:mRNA (2'-O-methyladenosine-N6-)-methyltransferase
LVDEIVWVKMTVNRRLAKSHGYYLQHAKEVCMVAVKNPSNSSSSGSSSRAQANAPQALAAADSTAAGDSKDANSSAVAAAAAIAALQQQQQQQQQQQKHRAGLAALGGRGVGSDVIFSERRGQSQKPEEIYELIEALVPGGGWHMFLFPCVTLPADAVLGLHGGKFVAVEFAAN